MTIYMDSSQRKISPYKRTIGRKRITKRMTFIIFSGGAIVIWRKAFVRGKQKTSFALIKDDIIILKETKSCPLDCIIKTSLTIRYNFFFYKKVMTSTVTKNSLLLYRRCVYVWKSGMWYILKNKIFCLIDRREVKQHIILL